MALDTMLVHVALLLLVALAAPLALADGIPPTQYPHAEEYAYFEEDCTLDDKQIKRLGSAELVASGHVVSISYIGRGGGAAGGCLPPVYASILEESLVDKYRAVVRLSRVISGEVAGKNIAVDFLRPSSDGPDLSFLQPLAPEEDFVFFLRQVQGGASWQGSDLRFFALRTEVNPAPGGEAPSRPEDVLRAYAKENILTSDENCAAIWLEYLRSCYDKSKDNSFCLRLADDPRQIVSGEAISLLCENDPQAAGLYEKAMAFAMVEPDSFRQHIARERVVFHLPQVLEIRQPAALDEELAKWLRSDKKFLRDAALKTVREGKRRQLSAGVMEYFDRTKDRQEQYMCYKTLCLLHSVRLISVPDFEKDPEPYVSQFRE